MAPSRKEWLLILVAGVEIVGSVILITRASSHGATGTSRPIVTHCGPMPSTVPQPSPSATATTTPPSPQPVQQSYPAEAPIQATAPVFSTAPAVPIDTTLPADTTTTEGPTTTSTSTTTTTIPITYAAFVNQPFRQSPTNPLVVSYDYEAAATIPVGGTSVAVSPLPSGTLELLSNGVQECSVPVGGTVTGGTCTITFSDFGNYTLTAQYTVDSQSVISADVTDNVQPFSTTTKAIASGGGAAGGLVLGAEVVDSNGNAVTTGGVTLKMADTTQNWAYTESGTQGGDGKYPTAFLCVLVENFPKVGTYGGCGLGLVGNILVVPQSGDIITVQATFAGVPGWSGSSSMTLDYTFP